MSDLATLQTQLAKLQKARASGVLRNRLDDREIWYRDDAELAQQIASIENQIAELSGTTKPRTIALRSEKGWL